VPVRLGSERFFDLLPLLPRLLLDDFGEKVGGGVVVV
jgi:hypothetical protein